MTSAISGSSGYTSWASTISTSGNRRPDPSKLSENLFAALDTKGQGYIEQSDLESAFANLSIDTSDAASAEAVFKALDTDADGKLTQNELSSSLEKLAEQLDSQFHQMRMEAGGMPPPPPPPEGEDEGYTQDELASLASEIGAADSKMSTLMGTLAANFDEADANGDGRVSADEAMAYDREQNSGASGSAGSSTTSSEGLVFKRIMQLAASYGDSGLSAATSSLLSVTA